MKRHSQLFLPCMQASSGHESTVLLGTVTPNTCYSDMPKWPFNFGTRKFPALISGSTEKCSNNAAVNTESDGSTGDPSETLVRNDSISVAALPEQAQRDALLSSSDGHAQHVVSTGTAIPFHSLIVCSCARWKTTAVSGMQIVRTHVGNHSAFLMVTTAACANTWTRLASWLMTSASLLS